MLKKRPLLRTDGIAVFLLGALFLFFSIGLVMLGGSAYRSVVDASSANDQLRTTLSFIANQVRRNDAQGQIEVGEFYGQDALLLTRDLGGLEYITYLYCWDGSLREMFVEKGYELEPAAGLALIPLDELSLTLTEQGLISVEAAWAGGSGQILLAPRSGVAGGEGG